MSEEKQIDYNNDHRKRLQQRYEQSEFQGFHDYEVLELLLTYAIPRKDTKETAKRLIAKFKNFPGVFAADEKELAGVEGIGPNAAIFLRVVNSTFSYYFEQKAGNQEIQFTNLSELVDYFRAIQGSKTNETMQVLYLNSQNKLIQLENVGEGTVSEAVAFPRNIVESALKFRATTTIIAHNNPGGLPAPSINDKFMTQKINDALKWALICRIIL